MVLISGVRSLREFSLLGLMGLALALLVSITVLPALLVWLSQTRLAPSGLSRTRIHFKPLVYGVLRVPRLSLVLCTALTLVVGFGVYRAMHDHTGWHAPLQFDSDLHALHPRPHPPLDTREGLADLFGASPDSLLIYVEADSTDAMLTLAQGVQDRFGQPDLAELNVAGVVGPASLLAGRALDPTTSRPAGQLVGVTDPQRVIDDFRAAADAGGFNPDAFGEYEDFLRTLLTAVPPTLDDVRAYPDLARVVLPRDAAEPTQGLVLVTLDRPWTTVERRNQIIDQVRDALAPYPGATLTGLSVIGYDTQIAIGQDLRILLWLAVGLVLVWLFFFFRRPQLVLLALLPAAVGILALLAVAHWMGWTLNVINLIALPLIVGIGVDDGIFLTAIYRQARRENFTRDQLIEQIAASTHAIFMTTLTTGLAFGSLFFTSVPAVQSLGLFTAVGVGAALLVSVLGLVPLLVGRYRQTA